MRGTLVDVFNEFEELYPGYEIFGGFGRSGTGFRIYDHDENKYVNLTSDIAKEMYRNLSILLKKYALGIREVFGYRSYLTFHVSQYENQYESSEHEKIIDTLEEKFGNYIFNISVTSQWDSDIPFIKFYYGTDVSDQIKEEIKDYVIKTWQGGK